MSVPPEGQSPDVLAGSDVGERVVRGGVQRAAGFSAVNLITSAIAVILLRHLGVENFGRYGTVLALVSIVYGISDAGLSLTGSRELALLDDPEQRRDLLAHVLGLRIVLTAAGILAAVLFALVAGYDRDLVLGTLICGIGIFLLSVQTAMLLPLAVELRNGTIALNEVLRQAVLLVCFLVLAVAGAGLVPFFGGQVVAGIVSIAVTPLLLARHHFVAPRWGGEQLRMLASTGLPVAIASVLGVLYVRMLVIEMSLVSSKPDEVGYFVTSVRFLEVAAAGFPVLLVSVVLPVLTIAARDNRDRLEYMSARTTEAMALGGGLVALTLWIAAHPIIVILGGKEYEPAVPVLQIQALASVTIFVAAAWQPTLIGLGRARDIAFSVVVGMVVVLVAGLVLIPSMEAQGAAVAAVLADVAYAGVLFAALWRAGPGRGLDFGRLGRILLAALPAVAIGIIPGVPDILLAIVAAGVYLGLALALGAVPSEMTDGVRAALSGRRAR
jgi:O-antigen/teichoic acid export membrane protein